MLTALIRDDDWTSGERGWIDPRVDGEVGGEIDIAKIDIVIDAVETEGLGRFTAAESRAVLQSAVVAPYDVICAIIAGPPMTHVSRLRGTGTFSVAAGIVKSLDFAGTDCAVEDFHFIHQSGEARSSFI